MHLRDGDQGYQKQELEERVLRAQRMPTSLDRERLIEEHKIYVGKIASRICHRSISLQDDEYSIALMGFNEAITQFQPGQQSSFLTFAYMVIQRRLTDFYRREKKHGNQVPLVPAGNTESEANYPEVVSQSFERYQEHERRELTRLEVNHFSQTLARYGVQLAELVKVSPKHKDTRENMVQIAKKIVADPTLRQAYLGNSKIGKAFAEKVGCHRRTLKRHQKYILALVVVMIEDLPLLKTYLSIPTDRKGGSLECTKEL